MHARIPEKVRRLFEALGTTPGALEPAARQSIVATAAATGGAGEGGAVPERLAAWVDKVARHAYRATDEDVAALRAAGVSEVEIFEATLAAAAGAALARFERGLAALAPSEESAADAPVKGVG
jgi:alkylhydroperoxidase family enzyme